MSISGDVKDRPANTNNKTRRHSLASDTAASWLQSNTTDVKEEASATAALRKELSVLHQCKGLCRDSVWMLPLSREYNSLKRVSRVSSALAARSAPAEVYLCNADFERRPAEDKEEEEEEDETAALLLVLGEPCSNLKTFAAAWQWVSKVPRSTSAPFKLRERSISKPMWSRHSNLARPALV
jgi:hypothetical protein